MKKSLLTIALIAGAAFAANAELNFLHDGEVITGPTFSYEGWTYVPVADKDGNPTGLYQFKVDPEIYLVSDQNATVYINVTANTDIQLCAGGDCITGDNVTKPEVALTANVPLNLQFDWLMQGVNQGEDIEVPEIDATISVTSGTETITLRVSMGGVTAGVESIGTTLNNISISGRSLSFDVANSAQLSLYSLSGKTILNKTVAGNGSISLANLPSGVYVYRLTGKTPKTGKFIIR
ncbi:MAG: T9SS type A sorting domain-containing protein [Muribaculaceae bacterium]|nr:T9SS type A sorting domain-containing protein [Muribaculaceae bacterium]